MRLCVHHNYMTIANVSGNAISTQVVLRVTKWVPRSIYRIDACRTGLCDLLQHICILCVHAAACIIVLVTTSVRSAR